MVGLSNVVEIDIYRREGERIRQMNEVDGERESSNNDEETEDNEDGIESENDSFVSRCLTPETGS